MKERRARGARLGCGALATVIALSAPLVAAPETVVAVIRPREASATITEVITRVRGELVAAGFRVVLVDRAPLADPAAEVQAVETRLHPRAVFAVFDEPDGSAAHVWIVDYATGKRTIERFDAAPDDAAAGGSSVQAVRAVELLRANLLALVVGQSTQPPPPPAPPRPVRDPAADTGRAPPPKTSDAGPATRGPLDLEAGAAVLHSFEGIGPTASPLLRAGYQVLPRATVRFTLSGLGTRPTLEGTVGRARIEQELGLVDAAWSFAEGVVRPFAALGGGVYHISAEGEAGAPYVATTESLWAAAFDAGAGARVSFGSHVGIALEAHALVTVPYPMIRVSGADVGRTGRPLILSSLTLVATP